jgi:hypothetical protein
MKEMMPYAFLSFFSTFGVYFANIYVCVANKKGDKRIEDALTKYSK